MIWNIIDKRERKYRWEKVNAVIESTWHDNSCHDADQVSGDDADDVSYEQRKAISVHDAIIWAEAEPAKVTLYLYDEGQGVA
tara:strand:- start:2122 stop:2367 length:246 start_codon:yes stop_codon:yes gene_type:complete